MKQTAERIIKVSSSQVNVGKMDSPIEKWNLIIGNLALKQVSGGCLVTELGCEAYHSRHQILTQ
jgi:hypothetical protein